MNRKHSNKILLAIITLLVITTTITSIYTGMYFKDHKHKNDIYYQDIKFSNININQKTKALSFDTDIDELTSIKDFEIVDVINTKHELLSNDNNHLTRYDNVFILENILSGLTTEDIKSEGRFEFRYSEGNNKYNDDIVLENTNGNNNNYITNPELYYQNNNNSSYLAVLTFNSYIGLDINVQYYNTSKEITTTKSSTIIPLQVTNSEYHNVLFTFSNSFMEETYRL